MMGNGIMRMVGALLLVGGVAVFSTACRRGQKSDVYWQNLPDGVTVDEQGRRFQQVPTDVERTVLGRDREATITIVRDEATGGIPEETRPEGSRPAGEMVPELDTVRFEFDTFTLTPEGVAVVERNAQFLRDNDRLMLVLRGHTDTAGTDEYNLTLGSRRAQSVREALVQRGISPNRIETVSFGRELPLSHDDTAEAHALNRRVEFFLFETE